MLKTIKQKGFQLACKQAKYGFTKVSHIAIPIEGNACTDKSEATVTVHFLWAEWFVHACHFKEFLLEAITRLRCVWM